VNRPTIVTLLKGPAARTAFRRALPRGRVHVVSCRSAAALGRLLATTLADAVVVDPRVPGALGALGACRVTYPGIPRFAYSAFRPDEAELLAACVRGAGAHPIVEGVEDAVLADLILPRTASAARLSMLAGAPRLLRLLDPLQEAGLARGDAGGSAAGSGPPTSRPNSAFRGSTCRGSSAPAVLPTSSGSLILPGR